MLKYCKFGIFRKGLLFIFAKLRSFVKIKSLRNGEITLSITEIGKSYPSREIFRSHVCFKTLFAKISGFTVASRCIILYTTLFMNYCTI